MRVRMLMAWKSELIHEITKWIPKMDFFSSVSFSASLLFCASLCVVSFCAFSRLTFHLIDVGFVLDACASLCCFSWIQRSYSWPASDLSFIIHTLSFHISENFTLDFCFSFHFHSASLFRWFLPEKNQQSKISLKTDDHVTWIFISFLLLSN